MTRLYAIALLLAAMTPAIRAADSRVADKPLKPASQPASAPADPGRNDLTVALLDFDAKSPGAPDLGSQIGEVLTATLSSEPGFRLVDRATLTRTLQEHELNLSGIVDMDKAVKIGKLVGARILVTGKAFPVGKKLFITAKLIGTETSLVDGVLIKGDLSADIGEMLVDLSNQIGQHLRTAGPKLVAQDEIDPLPALKKKLAGIKKPVVAVIITEEHMARQTAAARPVDPAVETEVKKILRDCGFEIADLDENALADWGKLMNKTDVNNWPKGLANADMVITGQAFSEFGARIGNLVSCIARAEVNVISRKDGKIVIADRETTRAVDLAEHIAGKTALQKAGRMIAIRSLEQLAKTQSPQAGNPARSK